MVLKHRVTEFRQGDLNGFRDQTAAYIFDMLKELEQIAGREHIEPLDQFLKIAREEAGRISNTA